MALDGAFLSLVRKETEFLIGSRVDKVYQPSRDEIVIAMRAGGGIKKLLISASVTNARVHITSVAIDNPKAPPMFCMLLRKHLGGGKLKAIRQDGLERILMFDFECINELGDMVTITLVAEIMGKYSNLIVLNQDGRIIDSIKRVDGEMSRERMVLPGMKYCFPHRDERLSVFSFTKEELKTALADRQQELSKVLVKTFEGISPVLAREWSFRTLGNTHTSSAELTEKNIDELFEVIDDTRNRLLDGNGDYCIVRTPEKDLKEFSFIRLTQYESLMQLQECENSSQTLDIFYAERDSMARLHQRANDLFKLLTSLSERITRRISNQKQELMECENKEQLKLYGDLLSANLYRLKKGDKKVTLENFYDESCPMTEIKLDERLTPSQNAQKYYSEYRKALTAEQKLAEQIEAGEEELKYIDTVLDALNRAETENEVIELRLELAEQGYIKSVKLKGNPPKQKPPIEYTSSDGYKILVGRNNRQNDKLTLKTAEKLDIWLHTRNIAGSHVIIVTNGETPPDRTIEEAGIIAVKHSKAKNSSQVPVDYTLVKYVKKPVGSKPGKVIFTHEQTIYITPEE